MTHHDYGGTAPVPGVPLATLRAQLVLKGFALEQLPGGGFVVGRWGLTRELADLNGLREFARRVGVLQ